MTDKDKLILEILDELARGLCAAGGPVPPYTQSAGYKIAQLRELIELEDAVEETAG